MGIAVNRDLNGPPHEGVGYQQFTISRGRRHSSYDAFVAPVRSRANLVVQTDVQVLRIRARRRLIGAAVLVAAGVVGFPLIFETQPRPIPVDLPIDIPRKDGAPPLVVPTPGPLARADVASPAEAP